MDEIFQSSVIKGMIFSAYDKFGPQPVYKFPLEMDDDELKKLKKDERSFKFTLRDYVQISIKNLSLLVGDLAFSEDEEVLKLKMFGILPYPDYNITSLTYFHFINVGDRSRPVASSFSILVDESKRSFLYNNINRIKPIISDFFIKFDDLVLEGYKPQEEMEPVFRELLMNIRAIEEKPSTPITSQRKMKILFAGLDDSGKTSFLLSVNRKYSKLIGLKPTLGVEVKSIQALGATIFLWDLGGQKSLREKYLTKSQIYLYEADLLFYFIDIRNKERYDESFDYLNRILTILERFEQDTSLIFIFSKADPDIKNEEDLQQSARFLKEGLIKILNKKPEIYKTSIFSIFSILRAFSSGVSKLSINKELINQNLKSFSDNVGIYLTLLLSTEGLVLADYYSRDVLKLTQIKEEEYEQTQLKNAFEITAPQFATLYKIFSKFKTLEQEEATFTIANSHIVFRRIEIAEYSMYMLILLDDMSKKEKIDKELPNFLEKTKDLLLRYIS